MAQGVQQFHVAAQATLDATKAILAATARARHAEVMAREPRPTSFSRRVDGKLGASEDAVKADGIIVYDYPRLREIVEAALVVLRDLSPVLSGEYRNAHHLFIGGAMVTNLDGWDGQGEVVICNYVPYARKIELGKMAMRVPGTAEVYEQAEAILKKRYGNVAAITFTFQGVVGGAVPAGRERGGFTKNRSELRYPCLRIRAR